MLEVTCCPTLGANPKIFLNYFLYLILKRACFSFHASKNFSLIFKVLTAQNYIRLSLAVLYSKPDNICELTMCDVIYWWILSSSGQVPDTSASGISISVPVSPYSWLECGSVLEFPVITAGGRGLGVVARNRSPRHGRRCYRCTRLRHRHCLQSHDYKSFLLKAMNKFVLVL